MTVPLNCSLTLFLCRLCNNYIIILSDGKIWNCVASDNWDIFHIPWCSNLTHNAGKTIPLSLFIKKLNCNILPRVHDMDSLTRLRRDKKTMGTMISLFVIFYFCSTLTTMSSCFTYKDRRSVIVFYVDDSYKPIAYIPIWQCFNIIKCLSWEWQCLCYVAMLPW